MLFRELNGGKCKSYLVADPATHRAVMVDPIRDNVALYVSILAYEGLKLVGIVDTHTHADHPTAGFDLQRLVNAPLIMHTRSPVPRVDRHVEDGDTIEIGNLEMKVLYTPGHTPDSISLVIEDRVLCGDVLLVGGTGRADFAGGDAGDQYDAITGKLFTLPDETLVYPAHDYRGNTHTSIGHEKRHNPRIAGRTRQQYIDLMNSINFPMPDFIQEVLQPNQSAIDDNPQMFPSLTALNEVRQLTPNEVHARVKSPHPPLLLDVREPHEYYGELGHITGSTLVPLKDLARRAVEFADHKKSDIVVVCRAGVRSTTGAAILTGLGFERVYNLRDGMLGWKEKNLPVEV
jgi:glyoxylase-like metal-dependent hydrolase (beta-lactamase superfamily II)/rhodanese-related sulfurtransferase